MSGMDKRHWTKVQLSDGHHYWDLSIDADPDVVRIMQRAQCNLTKEGYWRDVATDLARLVDELKEQLARLERDV